MKIARLGAALGIAVLTLAGLIGHPRPAHADTYCGESTTSITCCEWSGTRLVGCYTILK